MTLRELTLSNERWYLDTPLLIISRSKSQKCVLTVEEILANKIRNAKVIRFSDSSIYVIEEE